MSYRADVDGLRALAILTVVTFHALPGAMGGGFIGVDIFFVISGYLISSIIFRELKSRKFSFASFYARRIRRILPALLLVLAASLLIGWYVLFPREFIELGWHTLAGAAFVANLASRTDANYFDIESAHRPLLHLWSLGVEEQFYLIWPLLLWLTRASVRRAYIVISAVVIASFTANLFAIYVLHRNTFAFYFPLTRLWELGCGSLLALAASDAHWASATYVARTPAITNTMAVTGLCLIGVGLLTFDRYWPFPGRGALVPVLGSLLLIAAGPSAWVNRLLLGNPVAVFIGLISYPLYLWHWPLLVYQSLLWPGSIVARCIALLAAALLAVATYHYLEHPIRFSLQGRANKTRLLILSNCVVAVAAALVYSNHLTRPLPPNAARVLAAADDWDFPLTTALDRRGRLDVRLIDSGNPSTDMTLYIGDSHVQQYWPRLMYLSRAYGSEMNSIGLATYAGCPPLPGVNRLDPVFRCPRFFDQAIELAESDRVKVVVFAGWWEWYFLPQAAGTAVQAAIYNLDDGEHTPLTIDSAGGQAVLNQFGGLVRRLVAADKRVYVLLSNPTSIRADPISMVKRITYRVAETSSIDRREFEARAAPVTSRLRQVAERAGATVIDPADFLCDGAQCPSTLPNGLPLFKDSNHLRASYARQQQYLDRFNFE